MKKLLLILFLVFISTNARAEWVMIGEDDASIVYADPSTMRNKGDLIKIWSLYDFLKPKDMSGKSYLSMELQYEFDCGKKLSRKAYIIYYSANMGGGEKGSFSYPPKQWHEVKPTSAREKIFHMVCGEN